MTPPAPAAPRRVGVLVNPAAGHGRGRTAGAALRDLLAADGHTVLDVSGPDAVAAAARLERAGDLDALVVVGGDGMVHLGVQAVAGTPAPLGVVPVGTGNDFAACLGVPTGRGGGRAVEAVLASLRTGRARTVDAVATTGADGATRWVAGAVSAGLDAAVNARANAMTWPRGSSRYTLAALAELARFRAWGYRLRFTGVVDGGGLVHDVDGAATWAGRAAMVTAANTDRIGGGIRVTPHARVDDGLLDVLVAPVLTRAGATSIFPQMFSGRHLRRRDVHVVRAGALEITPFPPSGTTLTAPRRRPGAHGAEHPPAHGDGEPLGPLPLTVRAVPGALRVLGAAPGPRRSDVPDA
ncbi:diacylglycerol/lipid kinase family protein [Isoptericola aurantiacus]|uniref:diacylglycerol/lipid kinase family protein n=1 Tax=Isoptericola aurantiacus TaxID=3377839 RepID=UPI003839DD70